MKKQTFYSVLFCLMLAGCAVIESSPTYSSQAIRTAELSQLSETQQTTTYEDYPRAAYIITLNNDSLQVMNPDTGKTILAEKYDSGSTLAQAILKDNE